MPWVLHSRCVSSLNTTYYQKLFDYLRLGLFEGLHGTLIFCSKSWLPAQIKCIHKFLYSCFMCAVKMRGFLYLYQRVANSLTSLFSLSWPLKSAVLEILRNRTARRLRTAEWRERLAMHSLARHFFVILPSWVFQPSCCQSRSQRLRSFWSALRILTTCCLHFVERSCSVP